MADLRDFLLGRVKGHHEDIAMLKRVLQKILTIALDKPLAPPTVSEQENLSELQVAFREMPIFGVGDMRPSEAAWFKNMNRLRELVLNDEPRKFLRWDVVSQTMAITFARYILTELNYLKRRAEWATRWRSAIRESPVGYPVPYLFFPSSSATLIHHAYHVAKFEEKTRSQVQTLDYVLEFGGGFGSMCRLFHNLGFRGRYIIFDLPALSALQRYYLTTLGIPVQSIDAFVKSKSGVVCVSDIQQLRALSVEGDSMFVATWSLSESPMSVRDAVLPLVVNFTSFLIAYQDAFGEVNNIDFFTEWKKNHRGINWHNWPIEHVAGNNSYLIGKGGCGSDDKR